MTPKYLYEITDGTGCETTGTACGIKTETENQRSKAKHINKDKDCRHLYNIYRNKNKK